MSTERYLGMIVGYRKTLEQKLVNAELKKEERVKQLANAFAQTDIESIWRAASKLKIPHYDANKRLAGVEIELGPCGKFKVRRGMVVGLRICPELYGGPSWHVSRKKNQEVAYTMQQPSPIWDDERFSWNGGFTPNGAAYTAKDMRDSFLGFMALAIPARQLADIEPVDVTTVDDAPAKRKIMVTA